MDNRAYVAHVIYQSGRIETFYGKVRADGTPWVSFSKRVEQLRAFPTVDRVDVKLEGTRAP